MELRYKVNLAMININNRFVKILSCIAFTLITIVLVIIAKNPPAISYELSIYNSYPPYFWFFLVTSIACGIGIMLHQAFNQEAFITFGDTVSYKKPQWWIVGLIIIILTNSIFLLLPKFRGYALYGRGTDTLTHLGLIRDILNVGHSGGTNIYPFEHIFGANLILISHISIEKVSVILFVLLSGMYILNVYLLAKSCSKHLGQVLMIVVFASPLIYSFFHITVSPNMFALIMIPCLLSFVNNKYLFLSKHLEYTILLLLLIFTIVFSHPITTLFSIIIFFTYGLTYALYFYFIRNKQSGFGHCRIIGKNYHRLILITFTTFFVWYFSYSIVTKNFGTVYHKLSGSLDSISVFQAQLSPLNDVRYTLFQILELFINKYGAFSLFLLISSIACTSVIRRSLSKKHMEPFILVYAIQFIVFLFIGVIMLFGDFIEHNPIRIFRLALLMGTILNGLVVYDFISRYTEKNYNEGIKPRKRLLIIVTGIVIMAIVVLSLGNVYDSPRINAPNSQITKMDLVGMEWFDRSKSLANVDTVVSPQSEWSFRRFGDYIFGIDSSSIPRGRLAPERLPSNFGYGENSSVSDSLSYNSAYVLIFQIDKVMMMSYPENVRRNIPQWNKDDFIKLSMDTTISKIYDNSELDVWKIGIN